jgi:anthranilate phosphoribosyltransferase
VNESLRPVVDALLEGRAIDAAGMETAIAAVMDGRCEPAEIACLLTAVRIRGETVEALVGAARAMRARALTIPARRRPLLDTCGTGGDALHTFNISTATAFVAAAAGVVVAKHGNRSASSRSGSADVLEALGVALALSPEQVATCIDELGIGFCFAPRLHAAMKHAAPIRQQLGFRTVFNLLGPLTNPAGAEYQLVGASRRVIAEQLAQALSHLPVRRALVVCGNNELDEVSLWGTTDVWTVAVGKVSHNVWTAGELGLPECAVSALRVDGPEATIQAGVAVAQTTLDSGAAAALVATFAARTKVLAAMNQQ